jgi:3-oxoacyl-[acyl-carrier protein] reductase
MRTMFVTGGSRGIGKAIVEEFAEAGYAVAFTYATNEEAATHLAKCLRSRGHSVESFRADVRDYERAREVINLAQQALGPIQVLINNAGIKRDAALATMDPAAWHEVIDTNLTGTFNYVRVLMREMIRRGGAVINITSVSGQIGVPGQTNYSASKAGIIGFTKALAKEVARFGVRVNAIAPGFIESDMTAAMDEMVRKKLFARIPAGKPGQGRDVARLAMFLAEDTGNYVAGQVWAVDGGLS